MENFSGKQLRIKNDRFCQIEVKLTDGRLSVTGTTGTVLAPAQARKQALQYWVNYFEDQPEEIFAMNQRFNKSFRTALGAAKFVVATDGSFHGLDVLDDTNIESFSRTPKILVVESCGQIRDDLSDWFPEYAALLPWHLNDMKPGCEHQEALGWGRDKTIAITKDTATQAQAFYYATQRDAKIAKLVELEIAERLQDYRTNAFKRSEWLLTINKAQINWHEALLSKPAAYSFQNRDLVTLTFILRQEVTARLNKSVEQFDHAVYPDSIGAPCPECGYCYGSAWIKRELPSKIVALAESVGQ